MHGGELESLQWQEPPLYRRAMYYESARQKPLEAIGFAIFVFAAMLILRVLAGAGPEAHPPAWEFSGLLALVVALVMAYLFPELVLRLPGSIVILSHKGVNNNAMTPRGWRISFWAWDKITYASTNVLRVGMHNYRVLNLHGLNGEKLVTLGLRDRPSLKEIEGYLRAHGKSLRPSP
jgi:hypothetical protein